MASIIPGYEYDIFISYRQKDNRGDRWVSKLVESLRTELEATFKEDIKIYFDENPHDRLQETHVVDQSLEGKLKSLIFIPILSQTYCDPNSYAWQYELLAFNRFATEDHFGKNIRLRNGNYASRILPVRIHDLDPEDIYLFEKETGSALRAMDFVFKTATGVSRPLKVDEDHPHDNLNKTFYSDQINKVGRAIKEIIDSLKSEQEASNEEKTSNGEPMPKVRKEKIKLRVERSTKLTRSKLLAGSVIVAFIIALFLTYPFILGRERINMSGDEILKKAITNCDFFHRWDNYHGKVRLRTVWEDGFFSDEIIEIQTKENYYMSSYNSNKRQFTRGIKDGKCFREINGNKNPDDEQIKNYGLDSSRIYYFKQHHYCHFGLLMELKNSGLILQKKVESVKFGGNNCLALTFKADKYRIKNEYFYEATSWVIYLDPENYTMKGIRMSGKYNIYIIFSGILNVNDVKIPLCKTYFNSEDNSLKWIDVFSIAE